MNFKNTKSIKIEELNLFYLILCQYNSLTKTVIPNLLAKESWVQWKMPLQQSLSASLQTETALSEVVYSKKKSICKYVVYYQSKMKTDSAKDVF